MLVHSILFFVLGVAAVAFFITLLTPLIWRRMLFLAKKNIKNQGAFSSDQIKMKENFLKAQHTVEMARASERCALLESLVDEQKIKLDKTKEQLERIHKIEKKMQALQHQISSYNDIIFNGHQITVDLRKEQRKNNQEVDDCLMSIKGVHIHIAEYEEKIIGLKRKIQILVEKYLNLESKLPVSSDAMKNEYNSSSQHQNLSF